MLQEVKLLYLGSISPVVAGLPYSNTMSSASLSQSGRLPFISCNVLCNYRVQSIIPDLLR